MRRTLIARPQFYETDVSLKLRRIPEPTQTLAEVAAGRWLVGPLADGPQMPAILEVPRRLAETSHSRHKLSDRKRRDNSIDRNHRRTISPNADRRMPYTASSFSSASWGER